jgi:hypothetical protein
MMKDQSVFSFLKVVRTTTGLNAKIPIKFIITVNPLSKSPQLQMFSALLLAPINIEQQNSQR